MKSTTCWRFFLLTLVCYPILIQATPPQRVKLPEVMPGQFYLRAPRPAYRNFAFQPYTNYPGHTASRSRGLPYSDSPHVFYSSTGDYLSTGYDLYAWSERREPQAVAAKGRLYGSSILRTRRVFEWAFDNLVVARDSQGSWGYSAIVGDALIARFTPLTLSKVDFDGVRLDLASPSLQATLLGSRLERPGFTLGLAKWLVDDTEFADDSPLLLGGRLQGNLGRLQLGLTGVNLHMFRSTESGNTLKGVLRPSQPLISWVLFRFTDDSPADGRGGAVVQDPVLIVNGLPRSDLQAQVIRHRASAPSQVGTVSQGTGEFRATPYYVFRSRVGVFEYARFYRNREVPLYADYLYRIDHARGKDVSADTNLEGLLRLFQVEPSNGILQAEGDDQLVYLFDISREPYVESVALEAVLANDYKVDVATLIDEDIHAPKRHTQFKTTYYHTALRAKGNVQDRSNLQRVRLEVGENTALFTYSADAHLSLVGMEVHGEVARSRRYSRYPAEAAEKPFFEKGARSSEEGMAYFVNATRNLGHGRVGLEYFSMQPDFFTEIRYHLPLEGQVFQRHVQGVRNRTMYWQLVQDNDDGDRFTDARVGEPLDISDGSTIDPDGVFPGRDEDRDGIPDTNRNFNGIPDYEEPFLMFDVEPNEYVYGLDRNHNDEPDVREDDLRPDYPYFPDQQGYHLFLQLGPRSGWSASAGRYSVEGIAGDGRNRSTYALLSFRGRDTRERWRLFFENHLRRVEDDIADEFAVQVEQPQAGRDDVPLVFVSQIRPDPLSYRDSYVSETYLEGELKPWSTLRWVNKWRLRLNWQLGGDRQRARRLDYWTLVQSAEYTASWRKLKVRPQCKALLLRHLDQDADRLIAGAYTRRTLRSELSLIPILRIEYPIFRHTTLRLGVQGWGPLPYKRHDTVRERNNLERRTAFATLANRSAYRGYDLHTIIGIKGDSLGYDDRLRRAEEYDTWSFFVRVLTGFTEFGPLI